MAGPLTPDKNVLQSIGPAAPTRHDGERCTMSQVSETLVAWREAERRVEAAEDPDEIPAITVEAARLHEAYRRAIAAAAEALDVRAHAEPPDTGDESEP